MSIHLGQIVQKSVQAKRLTHKEFGALIHKNEKTIPDIYDRAAMSTDLLISISKALNTDFFAPFYAQEPFKSLRNDEVADLNNQIQKVCDENIRLQQELSLTQELVVYLKENIAFAKEQIELYKIKITGLNPG